MLPPKSLLDGLGSRISRLYDDSRHAGGDIDTRLRALLQSAFNRLDLVSREEFDRQALVLEHTRARLEDLEKRLDALQADSPPAPAAPDN